MDRMSVLQKRDGTERVNSFLKVNSSVPSYSVSYSQHPQSRIWESYIAALGSKYDRDGAGRYPKP